MSARILIVEDNADLSTILEQVLGADFEVRTALNGEDGIAIAQSFQPDLVLLDLQLPGINGTEAGQRIKEDAAPRFLPIIVLTALGDSVHEAEILNSGCCDAFMAKPVPLPILRAKVDELLYSHSGIT
jgi:DNA-binding response OmpR family regulator